MQIPRRAPRRRAMLLVLLLGLAAIVVVSTFGAGQSGGKVLQPRNNQSDSRNKALGEINGANIANDCWAHHKGEGMRDVFIVYPVVPKQLKLGEPYEIPVQIVNPWKQVIRKMSLDVSLLGDTQVLTVDAAASSAAAKRDLYFEQRAIVGPPATPSQYPANVSFPLKVPLGASAIVAFVELKPRGSAPPAVPGGQDGYDVKFKSQGESVGRHFTPGGNENRTALNRHYTSDLRAAGNYTVEVTHTNGYAYETDVYFNATVVMGGGGAAGAKTYNIKIPPDAIIDKGQPPYTALVKVTPFAAGVQQMEFHINAENYYKHQDASTPNEDFYNRYATLDQEVDDVRGTSIVPTRFVTVGAAFVPSEFGLAVTPLVEDQWQFVIAEIAGFSAAVLLLPSLLLGGTYGKTSRRLLNNILGGAKRRVMFHNLSSLALSLVAFVHIVLFSYEIRYTILMGILWGGLGALSLLILGLTGYYQVPLIQRHGYKWWRYTHLAFGLLVIVFVGYHMVADGPDFFFIKERLPQWINEINLAQK